ncbi:extracellular solute-binding protein [Wenxinia marina]|uniref:ABC-type oligopeptide transport system, periplasmic component n=1 Tax=Wenxinia marina DSM 24838 TaxID=1123501 RepID=A0A0D0Q4D9_9RHOB|nr:extracellular solute-binding protein [Wenxinia marina]KIQ67432.1 ABC-type oligopeptide transport system, periplasmic component [Wenxinia marina DSM 24838]GGL69556.1 ABC transporter substrate-binding protein [Wenxinia marina]
MTHQGPHPRPTRRPTDAAVRAAVPALPRLAAGALLAGAALIAAGDAWGQEAEGEVIESHGYTNFGELKYPADFEHLDYVNPDAPKGGEISIWSQGTFDSFNNYAREGVSAALPSIYYETILTGTADDVYGVYCYLCTTLEYPESRDWVIFNLRDDVTFSDGRPMTAEDIEFSFNLFMEQGIAEYRAVVESFIESVEVIDDHTIRFTFADEAPIRDRIGFAGSTPVFSKSWFEETGTRLDESQDAPFLGTGPYVLDSFDYNRQIVIGRNEDWWGAEHPFNIGRNNFNTIRVEYFADGSAAFEGFKAGEYTFRRENSSRDWATGYNFPAIQNGWVVQETIPDGNIAYAQAFVFNLDKPQWQDPLVREAIGLMFNFEWSNETLFYGLYDRVNSFWENSELEATGTPSEGELALLQPLVDEGLLPESILTDEAVMAPVNDASDNQPDRSVFREAGRLLDEAGWTVGDNGMRTKDGQTLTISILEYSPLFDRIVNPFIENLERLGIDATLDRVDTSQYVERRRSGDFDLTNHGFDMGFEPGSGLKQWYDSSTADDSSRNVMRLRNEAVDRLLPAAIEAETLEEMTDAVHAIDRVMRSLRFWVPQWYKATDTIAYYDMYRHPDNMPPYATGELDFWWYDAEAAERLRAAGAFN